MIVEQMQTATVDVVKNTYSSLFYSRDAELVSRSFIQLPGIVQVGVFGGVAHHGVGQSVNLALIVSDEKLFRKYLDLVHEYQYHSTLLRDARQVRLAVFDQVWSINNPTWDHFHPERKLNLRDSMDLVILPFDWQHRIEELEPMLGSASPVTLSEITKVVTFIETQA